MYGPLYQHFVADHQRLDSLLNKAALLPDQIDLESYGQFRSGILRHIWQEEKVLLPTIRRLQEGSPFSNAARLRLDHGAIAALVVPVPTIGIVNALRTIFAAHNPIEEEPNGLYDRCETLVKQDLESVLLDVHEAPLIPTMPCNPDLSVLEATKRAVNRSGYDFDEICR